MRILFLLTVYVLFAGQATHAQNLADVLSSIQERKIAVEQRRQVMEDYEENHSALSTTPPAAIEPIDWVVTTEKYPTTSGIESLSMEDRVKALNIAIREFDAIKTGFLNIEKSSLANEALAPAQLVEYTEFDLPSLGRADQGNYHALLQALALNVLKLHTLNWPYEAGKTDLNEWEDVVFADPSDESIDWPTSLSMSTEPVLPGAPRGSYYGFNNSYATDMVIVEELWDDFYDWDEEEGWLIEMSVLLDARIVTHVNCWLKSEHAPAPAGGVQLLAGEVVLLAQEAYNPGTSLTRDGINPSLDGRYKRMLSSGVEANQQDSVELILPAQELTVEGACHELIFDTDYRLFVPNGVSLAAIHAAGDIDFLEFEDMMRKEYGKFFNCMWDHSVWNVGGRKYQCMMMPTFVKGLDAAPETIALLRNLPSAGVVDPLVKIAPSPSVLLAIDLGHGSKNTTGYGGIGILNPKFHRNHHHDQFISLQDLYDYFYLDLEIVYEPVDPSFASELVFMGSTEDFHVHYETRRGAEFRAPLPEWSNVPGTLEDWDTEVHGWKTSGNFLTAWDRPRLRQVVGKHISTDIEYGTTPSDYERIVTIRRVPAGADLTPGANGLVDTSEFPTIRILTLKNPDHANGWPGPDKFSLEITDSLNGGDEKWTIKANDVAADPGLNDWTLETKKGTTLNAKTTYLWDDSTNKLTTKGWSGTGTNPATTAETIFPVDEDWFAPLSKPTSLTLQPGTPEQITTAFEYSATAHYSETLPSKITVTNALGPDSETAWQDSGIPLYSESGNGETPEWRSDYSIEESGNTVKTTQEFKGNTFATNWVTWTSETEIKTYSAPDGTISLKTDDKCSQQTMTLYGPTATPIPWAVQKTLNNDGTGSFHSYTHEDGTIMVTIQSGVVSGTTISEGSQSISVLLNGHPVSSTVHAITGGQSAVLLDNKVWSEFNDWGAPEKCTATLSGLSNTWTHDGAWIRISGTTNALGVTTNNLVYDTIGRLTNYNWNGNAGTLSFTDGGRTTQNSLPIGTLGDRGWSQTSDGVGNPLTARAEGGQPIELVNTYNGGQLSSQITDITTEASVTSTTDINDGSLASAVGTTLAFGGVAGDAPSIENGLFKSTTKLGGLAASYQTTWTDAWGRDRKISTTGTAGGDDLTHMIYSLPGSSLKRVEVQHPCGKRFIEESEPFAAAGSISRAGIDKNSNGILDAGDRYVTTTTTVVAAKIQTTLNQTGNATALMMRSYDPASGITITTLNGGENSFTETPNFAAKTTEVKHKRNGVDVSTKTIALNSLGQVDSTVISGTGMPSYNINPTFRADGSVEGISVNIGGATASASFEADGKLAAMTHPLLGALDVTHAFANGEETLSIDGTTSVTKLDGSSSSLSGAGVIARERETTIADGNFEDKITPATGSPTTLVSNAAGAKILHQYAAGANPQSTWLAGGLLASRTLGRNEVVNYSYTNDGARDLFKIDWPQVTSDGFINEPFYAKSAEFTARDDAGNITAMSDPAGQRALAYEKNRLTEIDWVNGDLNPYKVVREYDPQTGLVSAVILQRNGAAIHEITPNYTGASSELSGMAADNFAAAITRDETSRHVTGFTRGTVTQQWGRGTAGQITSANTNSTVTGAPTFSYSSFDTKGRRKIVNTNRGNWLYDYRGGNNGDGQLISASNATLNTTFNYNFDGIGRRAEFANNAANALNQFVAIEHPLVPKKLYISADPNARLWVNGTEITPFEGAWIYQLAHPGAAGGWVPWHVKGVVEDGGEAGAFPDAVAEFGGQVFFPPQNETFTFDADGNRESSSLWNYGWDGRNHLVRARTKTWDSAPEGWDVQFEYDAEGRRFKKNVTRYKDGAAVEQKVVTFVWDGWDLLYERHEDIHGNFLMDRKYVWGPDIADGSAGGAGGLLLIRETRGTTTNDYYPIYDGTGHVTGITDNTGDLVAEYWYGPFGELIEAKGPMAQLNPWRYATKYYDAEIGLYYFGFRYYDPTTGQWMNREPLGEDESLNLYSYCHNDPVNKVDVLGLAEIRINDISFFVPDEIYAEALEAYGKSGASISAIENINFARDSGHPILRSFYNEVHEKLSDNNSKVQFTLYNEKALKWSTEWWSQRAVNFEGILTEIIEKEEENNYWEFVSHLMSDDPVVSRNAQREVRSQKYHESLDALGYIPIPGDPFDIANYILYVEEDRAEEAAPYAVGAIFGGVMGYTSRIIIKKGNKLIIPGFEEHHILSDKNPLTKNHDLLRLADFDLQSRANKISLPKTEFAHPTRSIHWGKHLNDVSKRLAIQMNQVVEYGQKKGWTKDQYKEALREIIRQERQQLRLGNRVLNKNFRSWAK